MQFLIRIGFFLIIILVGFLIAPLSRQLVSRMAKNTSDKGVYTFLGSFVSTGIKIISIIIALSSLGVDISILVGIFTALGVGLSLALKNNMANVASGLQILMTRPFKVGDYIMVNGSNGNYEGTCKSIEIMYTTLLTYQNTEVIVPNSLLIDNITVNYSDLPYRRMQVMVSVDVNWDADKVLEAFSSIAPGIDLVLKDPAPSCALTGFSADGISAQYTIYAYATFDNYWNALYELNRRIQKRKAELQIPQPSQEIRIVSQEAGQ